MPKLITKAEEVELHRAINAGCPYHHWSDGVCLHVVLGKLIGLASLSGRFHPTVLPEDVEEVKHA